MVLGRSRRVYQPRHEVRWLVAGLGNPGPEYDGTPHNVGFDVVRLLAEQRRIALVPKHDGMYGAGRLSEDGDDIALIMPLTYMNLSGRSVRPALRAAGLEPDQLVVVHDEIDLPFGSVQVKFGGGLAGHNGLKSLAETCGTRDFARIRVGVGRPGAGDRRPIRDWILSPWDQAAGEVDQLAADAADAARRVVDVGLRAAMGRTNGAPP